MLRKGPFFFIILVILRDAFLYIKNVVLRPECRTKFLDYAGKPYNIGISSNGEIYIGEFKEIGSLVDWSMGK